MLKKELNMIKRYSQKAENQKNYRIFSTSQPENLNLTKQEALKLGEAKEGQKHIGKPLKMITLYFKTKIFSEKDAPSETYLKKNDAGPLNIHWASPRTFVKESKRYLYNQKELFACWKRFANFRPESRFISTTSPIIRSTRHGEPKNYQLQ